MPVRSPWVTLALLAWAATAHAQAGAQKLTLENGVTITLEEDHSRPRVGIAVQVDVGWMDDPVGHSGLAHLVEHVLFRAPVDRDFMPYTRWLEELGATDVNAHTAPRDTTFFELVPSSELARALWGESNRLALLLRSLDAASVERERDIVAHEERLRGLRTGCRAEDDLVGQLFYGRAADPAPQSSDPRDNTLPNVQWFFQSWYRPEHMRIALVGDFDPANARELLQRYFGTIRGTGAAARRHASAFVWRAHQYTIRSLRTLPRATVVHRLESASHDDLAALSALALELELRLTQRLIQTGAPLAAAVGTHAELDGHTALLETQVAFHRGQNMDDALRVVDEELTELYETPLAQTQLTRIGELVSAARAEARADFAARAQRLVNQDTTDWSAIEHLTPVGVRSVAWRALKASNRLTIKTVYDSHDSGNCQVEHE